MEHHREGELPPRQIDRIETFEHGDPSLCEDRACSQMQRQLKSARDPDPDVQRMTNGLEIGSGEVLIHTVLGRV